MNLKTNTTSSLSTFTTAMRKRPRTHPTLFDLPCSSALTSLTPPSVVEAAVKPNDLIVTSNPIDDALAELDVCLGLVCSKISGANFALPTTDLTIEEELDTAFAVVRKEHQTTRTFHDASDDTSCVSGSGRLVIHAGAEAKDKSSSVDVLHELQAFELRSSTTVMSPLRWNRIGNIDANDVHLKFRHCKSL